ncbi:hypothetical protein COCCADRAFT_98020 [Bipolaris zeicola 26-R-13]|uniref:Uncharacterized protein n=1 Tax=Cochliobolus carbonum (strain 26-R-13) TaxID=930089 RepID=W6Y517_COCC2|nr:uncharacterized protein COCCADRAFT_98020 [Bipolaris zeicola 26-R-13]EUC32720.1 hypothetical protein COCCADRAFT_98020 [Bipolaris zeicola 26-R-13]
MRVLKHQHTARNRYIHLVPAESSPNSVPPPPSISHPSPVDQQSLDEIAYFLHAGLVLNY